MRPLKSPVPTDALPSFRSLLTQPTEARIFRRGHAVHAVVAGTPITTVAATFRFAASALRPWGQRLAAQGVLGFRERPRSGRPPTGTSEGPTRLSALITQDPLQPGALASQWRCRDLATAITTEPGVPVGRERIRGAVKKTR